MTSLLALEGKLVEAKEGSRELDFTLHTAFRKCVVPEALRASCEYGSRVFHDSDAHETGYCLGRLPDYTSSIDAALALVSRCLPGYAIADMMIWPGHPVQLRLAPTKHETINGTLAYWSAGYGWKAEAATPALAICLALIRALAAKESGQ